MSTERMIADLVNVLESENAQIAWAGTISSSPAQTGLEPDSDPGAQLPALRALEQRRRADLDDALSRAAAIESFAFLSARAREPAALQ